MTSKFHADDLRVVNPGQSKYALRHRFVISYFQTNILADLDISPAGYDLLTGYGTSVLSALTAYVFMLPLLRGNVLSLNKVLTTSPNRSIPVAFIADYSSNRVLTLCVAVVWWSLMVVFQGLSKEFWQMICARLGMSFGQSATEAVSNAVLTSMT
jgi:MFS family permease